MARRVNLNTRPWWRPAPENPIHKKILDEEVTPAILAQKKRNWVRFVIFNIFIFRIALLINCDTTLRVYGRKLQGLCREFDFFERS